MLNGAHRQHQGRTAGTIAGPAFARFGGCLEFSRYVADNDPVSHRARDRLEPWRLKDADERGFVLQFDAEAAGFTKARCAGLVPLWVAQSAAMTDLTAPVSAA